MTQQTCGKIVVKHVLVMTVTGLTVDAEALLLHLTVASTVAGWELHCL